MIGDGAVVDQAIIDKDCYVGVGAYVGEGSELRPNRAEPERLYAGITIVGKRAWIPDGMRIGRNCRIDPAVVEADFRGKRAISSGETVVHAG